MFVGKARIELCLPELIFLRRAIMVQGRQFAPQSLEMLLTAIYEIPLGEVYRSAFFDSYAGGFLSPEA